MKKAELAQRLKHACTSVLAAEDELTDIDSRFGDADHGLTMNKIAGAISDAVDEAKVKGIHGKETTPFLLAKIKELTGGSSLDSNIQLVYNNAKLAAKTAVELAGLAKN